MNFRYPPLGLDVGPEGSGTYAIAAPRAERIDLCVFRRGGEKRFPLDRVVGGVHWGRVDGLTQGTHYGLRVHGPWQPDRGVRFNPAHVVIDPYAQGFAHRGRLRQALFHHVVGADLAPAVPLARSTDDNAFTGIHSVVTRPGPRPHPERAPRTPWSDTIIYETHVKGFSALNPDLPPHVRGTYAGLAHPVSIAYLNDLGVTAVELLPIHASLNESHLERLGLTNYWGYNTLSFFAPEPSYATAAAQANGPQAVYAEVQNMVTDLHEAGIEVILDVVYNHTAEGNNAGPTVSFRGIDEHEYYWHDPHSRLVDVTGTGNTLNMRSPVVIDLILRSLRSWVTDVGADGFRFDLASALGRDDSGFRPDHPLLQAIAMDPVLAQAKLIAEPWDVGAFGWQTGNFPPAYSEWNDAFRDEVRDFWLTSARESASAHPPARARVRELAGRLTGSADIFRRHDPALLPGDRSLRSPLASINFVTAHDGFTLHDLTAYNRKHNEANGENGRDGTDANRSFNHGAEGRSSVPEVIEERDRTARNLVATTVLSAGVPMLTAGDEVLRTQEGNNNAYSQDVASNYLAWEGNHSQRGTRGARQHEWVKEVLRFRRRFLSAASLRFFSPAVAGEHSDHGVAWFHGDGEPMTRAHWHDPYNDHLVALFPWAASPVLLVFTHRSGPHTLTLPGADWVEQIGAIVLDSSLGAARVDRAHRSVRLDGPTVLALAVSVHSNDPGPTDDFTVNNASV